MATFRRLIGIVLFVGLLVGAVLLRDANDQLVDIDYVQGSLTNLPLWVVIVASFGIGALSMGLILSARLARGGLAQRRYRKAVARLEAEVHQLRNLPIVEGAEAGGIALPATAEPAGAPEGADVGA